MKMEENGKKRVTSAHTEFKIHSKICIILPIHSWVVLTEVAHDYMPCIIY